MIWTETFSLLPRISFSSTSASVAEASEAFNAFREIVHENRLQPSSGPYRLTYGKQRIVRNFEVGESVNVADLTLDRASTNAKRVFWASPTSPQRALATRYGPNTAY